MIALSVEAGRTTKATATDAPQTNPLGLVLANGHFYGVGEEMVAIDMADAGVGDIVLTNNDGGAAKMITGDKEIIAGLTICGVVDSYTWQGRTIQCH